MSRKDSAIIRIIAFSVAAVALCVILIMGLTGKIPGNFILFGSSNEFYYANAGEYKAGGSQLEAADVRDIQVNWSDGNVNVTAYDGDTIKFSENSRRKLKKKEQLHYYCKNGKLIIQYRESGKIPIVLMGRSLNKDLELMIPNEIAEKLELFTLDTVSAASNVSGIHAQKLVLNDVSGGFELENCTAEQLNADSVSGDLTGSNLLVSNKFSADTTSGNVTADGSFGEVRFNSVSGSMSLKSQNCPKEVRTDTVSGSVELYIPDNEGFSYSKDSVSGSVKCEFDVSSEDDRGDYKNGSADFSFESVSGDVSIKKK